MNLTILTRYFPCETTRPARIRAWSLLNNVSYTFVWEASLSREENYRASAEGLCEKLGEDSLDSLVGSPFHKDMIFILIRQTL